MSQFIEMFGNPLSPIQKWPIVRLGDYCIVNPTRPKGISDEMEVSFIPMQDVYDDGACNKFINRPYAEVKKGFTYCADGDVIFAKITPCMENGKGAELQGLTNAMGMGSTEFHVLRPISGKSISTWLYHFTKLDIIRKDAAKNMTGTGGQKRVPASYFDNFKIGVPSIDEQMNFAALANQADKSKFGDFKSQFIEMFGNPVNNSKSWPTKAIMEVAPEQPSKKQMPGKVWLLNLDMIESNTGKVIEKVYEISDNTLSVQPFDEDNVLFSKLRPYLNKVVVPDEYGLATTELVPLRPNQEVLNKVFLSYLLRSQQFVTFANKISGGTKMPRMPLAELRNFKCILPPMSEQLKFVSIAKQADKSKSYVWTALKNLESMLGYYIRQ